MGAAVWVRLRPMGMGGSRCVLVGLCVGWRGWVRGVSRGGALEGGTRSRSRSMCVLGDLRRALSGSGCMCVLGAGWRFTGIGCAKVQDGDLLCVG